MPDTEIVLDTPQTLDAPTTPYDRVAVNYAQGWRLKDDESGLVYTVSVMVRPYRIVDGVVDMAPEKRTQVFNIGDVEAEILADTANGRMLKAIATALRARLAKLRR